MEPSFLASPLQVDGRGRSASASGDPHIRQLIAAVLFTSPGERVNRPDFGCSLKTLVFAPASEALAGATQLMIRAALQRWLEQEIVVDAVEVSSDDATLTVLVSYRRRDTDQRVVDAFSRPIPGGAR